MPAYITSFNNKPLLTEFLRAEGNVKYVSRQKSDYTLQTIATELFINKHTQGMFPEHHQLNIFYRRDEFFVFLHRKVKILQKLMGLTFNNKRVIMSAFNLF